jgi:hypothetical protein
MAAQQLGLPEVPVILLDHLSEAQRRALVIADNRLAENAGWDHDLLRAELAALRAEEFDLDLLGFDDAALDEIMAGFDDDGGSGFGAGGGGDGEASSQAGAPGALAERFGVPPFSVLDARKGWWQDRKRAWTDLGIRSELGRGAAPGGSPRPLDRAKVIATRADRRCRRRTTGSLGPAAMGAGGRCEQPDVRARRPRCRGA